MVRGNGLHVRGHAVPHGERPAEVVAVAAQRLRQLVVHQVQVGVLVAVAPLRSGFEYVPAIGPQVRRAEAAGDAEAAEAVERVERACFTQVGLACGEARGQVVTKLALSAAIEAVELVRVRLRLRLRVGPSNRIGLR